MEWADTVYTSVVPSDVKAQDLGDTVVLTGSCRISVNSGAARTASGSASPMSMRTKAAVADGDLAVDPLPD